MVATAVLSGILAAAASTAEPPKLCPTRSCGAACSLRSQSAAATRSAMLEEKLVLANSPSLPPSPVKSKRSTAKPAAASAALTRAAASVSFEQVKQWANSAYARGVPSGRSRRAASRLPSAPGKVTAVLVMAGSPG